MIFDKHSAIELPAMRVRMTSKKIQSLATL